MATGSPCKVLNCTYVEEKCLSFQPMKPKQLFTLLLTAGVFLQASSQSADKQNPVLFGDVFLGHAWGRAGGISMGAAVHFQKAQSLFTLRYGTTARLNAKVASIWVPIPLFEEESSLEEISVLYGRRRLVSGGSAISVSLGLSANSFKEYSTGNNQPTEKISRYVGFPFEGNIKWFKARKDRFRIFYGLVPVGRPTAFGRSFGLKLSGNFSKYSYAGLSLAVGLGLHKKY
jgi:hypothetical protein